MAHVTLELQWQHPYTTTKLYEDDCVLSVGPYYAGCVDKAQINEGWYATTEATEANSAIRVWYANKPEAMKFLEDQVLMHNVVVTAKESDDAARNMDQPQDT